VFGPGHAAEHPELGGPHASSALRLRTLLVVTPGVRGPGPPSLILGYRRVQRRLDSMSETAAV
jgi:hypothetical protein